MQTLIMIVDNRINGEANGKRGFEILLSDTRG